MRRITIALAGLLLVAAVPEFGQQPESTTRPGLITVPAAAVGDNPYRNFKFRLSLGGSYVAAFSEMQVGSASAAPRKAAEGALSDTSGNVRGGVPVVAPGSLVGLPGTVTLLCSAVSGAKAEPGTVTLVCAPPAGSTAGSTSPAAKQAGDEAYETITLRRGISQDSEFQIWLSSVRSKRAKDLSVDAFDEAGKKTGGLRLTGCRIAAAQASPSLDGTSNTFVIQLDLHCNSAQSQ